MIPNNALAHHTPFGSMIENRSWSAGSGYRYGFNGMEADDETNGKGNSLDYGARMYDPRLGRFISRDPMASSFAAWSTYQYAANSPISLIDEFGYRPRVSKRHGRVKASIKVVNDGKLTDEDLVKIREGIVNGLEANGIKACITIEFTDSKGGLFGSGFMAGWFSDNVYVQSTEKRSKAQKKGSKIWLNENFDEGTSFHEFCHLLGLSDRYHYVANYKTHYRQKDANEQNEGSKIEITKIYDVPMGSEQVDNDPSYKPHDNAMSSGSNTLTSFQTKVIFSQFIRPFGERSYRQVFAFRQLSRGDVGQLNYKNRQVTSPVEKEGNPYVKPGDIRVDKDRTTDNDDPIIVEKVGGNEKGRNAFEMTTNRDKQELLNHIE